MRTRLMTALVVGFTAVVCLFFLFFQPRSVSRLPDLGVPILPTPKMPTELRYSPLPAPGLPDVAVDLDSFQFGEPKVIFTHTSVIGIFAWLPGSQQLLLTLQQPGVVTETIETFDVGLGQRRLYGTRRTTERPPLWLAQSGQLVYPDRKDGKYQLYLSDPIDDKEPLPIGIHTVDGVAAMLGQQVLVTDSYELQRVDLSHIPHVAQSLQTIINLQMLGFEPNNWRTRFRMVGSPVEPQIALYDIRQFMLVNVETGISRTITLDADRHAIRWAYDAVWSPDGQKLALITTVGEDISSIPFTALTIMDVPTGELLTPQIGSGYVMDLAWSPDSEYLVVQATVHSEGTPNAEGLFLVDAINGRNRRILPDYSFGGGQFAAEVVWSSDGQMILTYCPTPKQGQICKSQVFVK